jgi:hypothetical protein
LQRLRPFTGQLRQGGPTSTNMVGSLAGPVETIRRERAPQRGRLTAANALETRSCSVIAVRYPYKPSHRNILVNQ